MIPVVVPAEYWTSRIFPEGVLEFWLAKDGDLVRSGEPLATLRIEDNLIKLAAPASGTLCIESKANAVIDPGAVIGQIRVLDGE